MKNKLQTSRFKSRLGKQFAFYIIIFSSIFTLFITALQLRLHYVDEIDQREDMFSSIQVAYADSVALSVWSLNKELIDIQLKSILSLPGVEYVKLHSLDSDQWEAGTKVSSRTEVREYRLSYLDNYEIGGLSVTVSMDEVYEELLNYTLYELIGNTFKTFCVVLFIFLLVQRMMTNKLLYIERFLNTLEPDKPTEGLVLQSNYHENNELDALADHINGMLQRQSDYLSSIKETNAELNILLAERDKLLEYKRELNKELENKVKERTLSLSEKIDELDIEKLKAEKANRAKTDFISSMSHELRTPLNAIIGFAQLFQLGISDPKVVKENAEEIQAAGDHLLALINDILDVSKIESEAIEFEIEPTHIWPLLIDSLAMVSKLKDQYNVQIKLSESHLEYEFVLADKLRLKQVVINLLSNAIKYNKPNGMVTIQCLNELDGMYIKLTDTGSGLSAEQIKDLFTPFNRLGREKSEIQGTGIGLVICKQLVEKMNGQIGVVSELGKGSEFWVKLPLDKTRHTE